MKAFLLGALALISTPVMARSVHTDQILRAGHYSWFSDTVQGHLRVRVNLHTQMAYVYDQSTLIAEASVSTGRGGFETETGRYAVQGKELNHHSQHYDADMPFTMWFDQSQGVALHAGGDPGLPSSHGCVHLPLAFAQKLYPMMQVGDRVDIVNEGPQLALNL